MRRCRFADARARHYVPAVREMRRRFGDRIYGRYGFADAFHPVDGWVNPDVIGIDLGITLLSAENLRWDKSGNCSCGMRRSPRRWSGSA